MFKPLLDSLRYKVRVTFNLVLDPILVLFSLIPVYILHQLVASFAPFDPVYKFDVDSVEVEAAVQMSDSPNFDSIKL